VLCGMLYDADGWGSFVFELNAYEWLVNEDGTRSFLCLTVDDGKDDVRAGRDGPRAFLTSRR